MKPIEEMSLYEKIMEIKCSPEIRFLQKDSENHFGKFNYFSSSQITNAILLKLKEYRIMSKFNFPKNQAILNLINLDNFEEIDETVAYMPDFHAMSGKMGLIMSVGSYHTFMKRYLYMDVFEICEADPEEIQGLFHNEESESNDSDDIPEKEDFATIGDVLNYAQKIAKDNKSSSILKEINKIKAPLKLKQETREQLLQDSVMINKHDTILTVAEIYSIVKEKMKLNKTSKKPADAVKILDSYHKIGLCDKDTCHKVATFIMGLKLNKKGELII